MIYAGEGKTEAIPRADIQGLIGDETFVSAWMEWSRYKRFGLPHGQGWRAERPQLILAIEILDQEFELYQSEEMKRVNNRR